MLTIEQIDELRKIVEDNHSIFIVTHLGESYLTESEKLRLKLIGIDTSSFTKADSLIYNSFFLGVLSDSIGLLQAKNLQLKDLKEFISKGQYLPLTTRELFTIQSIEQQSLKDIRGLQGKIFSDVNQVLINNTKLEQEKLIRETIKQGTIDKKVTETISRDLSHKTGDWSRDFDRIVQFTTQTAYEEGKVASIEKYSEEKDPLVYKTVYPLACRHCIRLYLTNGVDSEPRIFRLSELRANGTNIGLKVDDWKPVIGPVHPFCRCNLHELRKGEVWDSELKMFILDKEKLQSLSKRKRIKIQVGNKEFIG